MTDDLKEAFLLARRNWSLCEALTRQHDLFEMPASSIVDNCTRALDCARLVHHHLKQVLEQLEIRVAVDGLPKIPKNVVRGGLIEEGLEGVRSALNYLRAHMSPATVAPGIHADLMGAWLQLRACQRWLENEQVIMRQLGQKDEGRREKSEGRSQKGATKATKKG